MSTYTLVLLRHGESTWNRENLFTGWTDVGLTDKGRTEARDAGKLLRAEGYGFDCVHTSLLRRAIHTANMVLEELELDWLPVTRSWRLNERHYGALQGLNKKETTEQHGEAQVHVWRRSYDIAPPPLELGDARHPGQDARYSGFAPDMLPATECLADVVVRFLPWWHDTLVPALRAGQRPLVVAHGNTLRALIKHLDGVSDEEIAELNIPTGIPLVYEIDHTFRPLGRYYLGDPEAAARAAAAVAAQAKA